MEDTGEGQGVGAVEEGSLGIAQHVKHRHAVTKIEPRGKLFRKVNVNTFKKVGGQRVRDPVLEERGGRRRDGKRGPVGTMAKGEGAGAQIMETHGQVDTDPIPVRIAGDGVSDGVVEKGAKVRAEGADGKREREHDRKLTAVNRIESESAGGSTARMGKIKAADV